MQQFKLILSFFLLLFFPFGNIHSQNEVNQLFQNDDILSLKLSYSNKDIQRKTNDSTYIETDLYYKDENDQWLNFPVALRARGNFRRNKCYFPPIKMKIKIKF